MKQLPMTPELSAMIKKAVGEDVDTTNLAVFETISLNTKPLPGKDGTIFGQATVSPATLAQMTDYINSGNHIPQMADHVLMGAPLGRVFHAGLDYDNDDGLEMRTLFYLDPTEDKTIGKLNSGSLDEVSVSFLPSSILCSACQWDYTGPGASTQNLDTLTCANGHTIGVDGVHTDLVGLSQFIEQSVVARGAADKPKIVGKSTSKLAPSSAQAFRLAANGFEPSAFVVQASIGKEDDMTDVTNPALLAQLTQLSTDKGALTVELSTEKAKVVTLTSERDTARTELAAEQAKVTTLTAELATAKASGSATDKAEADAALVFLGEQLDHLVVAKGDAKLEGEARPKTVAEFKAKIAELTNNLTSILPVGGVAKPAGQEGTEVKLAFNPDAYSVR